MGRCQQRNCFLLLTRLDHCSYENRTLPGSPRPALISMSLTHVHLRVSDMRIVLRTYRAVAFDPERQREAPSTHEGDAPRPQAEGSLGSLIRIAIRSGEARQWCVQCVWLKCVLRYDQWYFGWVCECANSLRDLHVKRGHRGRLVDVASLGMSVINWHGRMEGREELWCSCIE